MDDKSKDVGGRNKMKILLISGLGDYGWWEYETRSPRYYNWGAFGDLFPNDVFYVSLIDFFERDIPTPIPDNVDVVMILQCKSPECYHIGVMKKAKQMYPDAKIVFIQEDDILAVFRMSKQGQIDHFNAIREYVDMIYTHVDERALAVYSNVIDHHNINYLYTPYPIEWASKFKIPYSEREFDWLVTGSISKEYGGILAVQHKLASLNSRRGVIRNHKYMTTMHNRYGGTDQGIFNYYLNEMHWHRWLREIANCKRFYKTSFEVGSRSMEIACKCLGIDIHYADPTYTPLPKLHMFSFDSNRKRIKKELEELIDA